MAKKNKRQVNRSAAFVTPQKTVEFNPDYTQTKRDLTRIGTLAGVFFVALVVLSFFLK